MSRPVTLFTGQWADLPLDDLARKAKEFGYQGLELACWGIILMSPEHLRKVGTALAKRDQLERHDLAVYAISNHLVGQAVCDRIDERHKSILPACLGRWKTGRSQQASRRRDEENGQSRAEVRCFNRERVYWLWNLAPALLFSTGS